MKSIYFVAPSFGVNIPYYKKRFNKALKNLESRGYDITIGPNVYLAKDKAASNTAILRAKEINDAFKSNPDIVWSVAGGEVMIEMLEYVDFDIIKKSNSIFVGFSDNTNLTYTITTILDKETIYGVSAPALSTIEYDSLDTLEMINGKNEFIGYKNWQYEYNNPNPIHKYEFDRYTKMIPINYTKPLKGKIIGGCLDCLISLCGTKFDNTVNYMKNHKNEGIIFFMEACDLNSISLIRGLTQLKYAGWFDLVDAFIIGRSNNINDKSFNISMIEAYKRVLLPFNKPMILDCPIGHLSPTLPIKLGSNVEITYNRNNIKFNFKD